MPYYLNGCQCCPDFIKTLGVIEDGGDIVLVVASKTFESYERICLCIAQSIPSTATAEAVYIQPGLTGTTRYPLLTIAGQTVYSYQIKSRKRYPITVNTSGGGFVIHPKHLTKTTSVLTPPATPAANQISAAIKAPKTNKGDQNE